jgi:serine/threonine-protein kinase
VQNGELFLVMDYVNGESLANLLYRVRQAGTKMPIELATFVATQTLLGLHAAHEATNEAGEPLQIIHRDVSPHNVLVGADGIVRIIDFGVAKAAARLSATRSGHMKGKLAYVAPEQLGEGPIDRRVDVFTASIVLYEMLTLRQLFVADDTAATLSNVLTKRIDPPRSLVPEVSEALDQLVLKGLSREPALRFATAHDMARALGALGPMAGTRELADWVQSVSPEALQRRTEMLAAIEAAPTDAISSPAAGAASGRHDSAQPELTSTSLEFSSARGYAEPRGRSKARWIVLLAASLGAAFSIWGAARGAGKTATAGSDLRTPPAETLAPSIPPAERRALPEAKVGDGTREPSRPSPIRAPSAATTAEPSPSGPRTGLRARPPQRSSRAETATPTPETGKAKPNCDPPFTLNPDGTKRFKPECF